MPLDSLTVSALAQELAPKLVGGRIDKVQQPERDMLLISLRSGGENIKLLLSAGVGSARVHISETSFDNPNEAPMFCMLMRKHIIGARISDVYQPNKERMLIIKLDCRDELGIATEKKLVAEMIGRSSNLSLVDADGRIIDCMRRMDFGGDSLRRMLPGMIYRMPPRQDKAVFMETSKEIRNEMIKDSDKDQAVDKWLLNSFSGLSPLLCRELAYRCGDGYETLPELLDAFYDSADAGEAMPYMLIQDGKPLDFSFMEIKQYGSSVHGERFESFSALLDAFYSRKDKAEQQRRRGRELNKSVKTIRDRVQRKLNEQRQELRRTEDREALRRNAELVKANIYRLSKGQTQFECENYFEDGFPIVSIALDPLKSPQQNVTALFKAYNKLKTAESHLTGLISKGEAELDYLNSVMDELERAENESELSDIRKELTDMGYLRQKGTTKSIRRKPQAPLHFISDDGFEILIGRNNTQNDELTTKIARRTDMWLHTQRVHGSHVIIRCDGLEPPETTIAQAASLAVYYSQAREGGKTAVDITMVKNVRKGTGAMPGKVLYTDYTTVMAESDGQIAERVKR